MINETEPKRGRGRPRINPAEPVRFGKVTVYIEPSMIARTEKIALKLGLRPSEFNRMAIYRLVNECEKAA